MSEVEQKDKKRSETMCYQPMALKICAVMNRHEGSKVEN
jgi:hypothetical protein